MESIMRLVVARYVPLARFVRGPKLNSEDNSSLNEARDCCTSRAFFECRILQTESRVEPAHTSVNAGRLLGAM
jgi:hypothetical protein